MLCQHQSFLRTPRESEDTRSDKASYAQCVVMRRSLACWLWLCESCSSVGCGAGIIEALTRVLRLLAKLCASLRCCGCSDAYCGAEETGRTVLLSLPGEFGVCRMHACTAESSHPGPAFKSRWDALLLYAALPMVFYSR